MGFKVITPPTQVIPIGELRAHLNLGTAVHPDDALVIGYLAAARGYAQHYTGRAIGSQTIELALDEFPVGSIELPLGPVIAPITSIKYLDEAGVEQTLSNTLYTLDDYGLRCWAVPAANTNWPSAMAAANAVKVLYVAGDLPDAVRGALLLLVGNMYENREANVTGTIVGELPLGVRSMLDTEKVWGI